MKTVRYALISVSDKTGIADFARALDSLGFKIISTGGTAKALTEAGLNVTPIQDITGNPESFDGRMKTISFQIESGILFDRSNPDHLKQACDLDIKPIEIVVCNLYPFEKTPNVENIDVGGPTMVRSAAKNFQNVLVVIDPNDYETVARALKSGSVTDELRQALAAKAFNHLSFYDAQIARHLGREQFPAEITLPGRQTIQLRYGENPHQEASWVYFEPNSNSPLTKLARLSGRELSYVNFTDIAAGLESVRLFAEPAAVVIKHNSPCGLALGKTSQEALVRAVAADSESAFGGVIVLNQSIDRETADAFVDFKKAGILADIVAAPSMTEEAAKYIGDVRKSTGIYTFGEIPQERSNRTHLRFFDGGFIRQDWDDNPEAGFSAWKVATSIAPTKKQLTQMEIGWKFITRIRSNSVIVVDPKLPMTRGIGSGQTSRFRSTKIALEQAGSKAKRAILVSDSFFPFPDSVEKAAEAGIGAIVQQGGSIKDEASIAVANSAGIPMVFTGRRAFWH